MSKIKIFFLLLICTFIAYGASLKYGFSQDDWFHISISQASSVTQFLSFFNPFGVSWIFFRPLSTEIPYWLATTFLPLTQAAYFMHFCMLIIQVLNAYLVFQIGQKYLNKKFAIILSIFYAISNIHFLSLFYIGAIQQLLSTTFSLLAIKHSLTGKRPNQLILASLTLCALLSKEIAIRLPLILLILSYFSTRDLVKSIKSNIGPIIVTVLYLFMRLIISTGGASEYFLSLNPATTLASIMWYGLFSLSFPELILQYGQSHGLINFVQFFLDDPLLRGPIFLGAISLSIIVICRLILSLKKQNWSSLIFLLIALLSLLPIIFLPTHRYPHYLDLSFVFVGVWLLRGLTQINWKTIMFFLIIGSSMLASIAVDRQTHWSIKRAILAQQKMQQIIAGGECNKPEGISFSGSPSEVLNLSYALSLANGPRVICHNPTLRVYYSGITQ